MHLAGCQWSKVLVNVNRSDNLIRCRKIKMGRWKCEASEETCNCKMKTEKMKMARKLKRNKWLFYSDVILFSFDLDSITKKIKPHLNQYVISIHFLWWNCGLRWCFVCRLWYNCGQRLEGWQWEVCVYVLNMALTDADSDSGSFTLGDGGQ